MAVQGSVRLIFVLAASAGLFSTPAFPQSSIFNRATPDAENALRARVKEFFEAQQQGKWRQAERYVAEDSIDAYLERDKVRYESFELRDISWDKDYKEAKVLMLVPYKMDMSAAGVTDMPSVPRPITHHWRFEEGNWFWYVPKTDPCAPIQTPVGEFKPECKDGKPVQNADIENSKKALSDLISNARAQADPTKLAARVTADKKTVALKSKSANEGTVTITNSFDGPLTLDVIGAKITGLSVFFDAPVKDMPGRAVVEAKKTAVLRLRYQPGEVAPPGLVGMQVSVQPLNVILPVEVQFE